jgi:cytochrome c-type biogenesis protein
MIEDDPGHETMKRLPRAATVIVSVTLAAFPAAAQSPRAGVSPAKREPARIGLALAPGSPAPQFAATDLDGRRSRVAYDGHRATLLAFWTSACVPCKVEGPALQKLFLDHGGRGLQVLGVDATPVAPSVAVPAARAFLAEHGGTYPVLLSTREIENQWGGVTAFPTTFLVGPDGRVVRRYLGADEPIVKGLVADVEALLAGQPLAAQVLPERTEDVSEPR